MAVYTNKINFESLGELKFDRTFDNYKAGDVWRTDSGVEYHIMNAIGGLEAVDAAISSYRTIKLSQLADMHPVLAYRKSL